jgi:NAD(P)H-dependent flavin oxidoreductase YrpB (nitropropane dioxygenase family)
LNAFLHKLGIELPIIQAPMAGVSTPEMAAAVSNAGGLGSLGVGSADADATYQMIAAVRARTERPFQVNVFCNKPAVEDAAREASWLARLESEFARYGAKPPPRLTEIYPSLLTDDAKLAVLVAERPQSSASTLAFPPVSGSRLSVLLGSCSSRRRRMSKRRRLSPQPGSMPSSLRGTKPEDIAVSLTPTEQTIGSER